MAEAEMHIKDSVRQLHIVSGQADPAFGRNIAEAVSQPLDEVEFIAFDNGESHVRYGNSIRGSDTFIIQSHARRENWSVNDSLVEQVMMIDAAKRASAKRITAVCPYLAYSRQDKKHIGREPIAAAAVVSMLVGAGADRLMCVDLHAGQVQGFTNKPIDHLTALPLLAAAVEEEVNVSPEDYRVVAPDTARNKVSDIMGNLLQIDPVLIYRTSTPGANATRRGTIGEIEGKHCLIVDDMIETAKSSTGAAELLHEEGAKSVDAMVTHGLFSTDAIARIQDSPLQRIFVTDTLPFDEAREKLGARLQVISVAEYIGSAILRVFNGASISELTGGHNQF